MDCGQHRRAPSVESTSPRVIGAGADLLACGQPRRLAAHSGIGLGVDFRPVERDPVERYPRPQFPNSRSVGLPRRLETAMLERRAIARFLCLTVVRVSCPLSDRPHLDQMQDIGRAAGGEPEGGDPYRQAALTCKLHLHASGKNFHSQETYRRAAHAYSGAALTGKLHDFYA